MRSLRAATLALLVSACGSGPVIPGADAGQQCTVAECFPPPDGGDMAVVDSGTMADAGAALPDASQPVPDAGGTGTTNYCNLCLCGDGTCPTDSAGNCDDGKNCAPTPDAGGFCGVCTCDDGTCPTDSAGDCADGTTCAPIPDAGNYCTVCVCGDGTCPYDSSGDCGDGTNCLAGSDGGGNCDVCYCSDGSCPVDSSGNCSDGTNCLSGFDAGLDAGTCDVCFCDDGSCPIDSSGNCSDGTNCLSGFDAGLDGGTCNVCFCDDGSCAIDAAGNCSDGTNCLSGLDAGVDAGNTCATCTCSDGSCGDASGACSDGSNCLGVTPDAGNSCAVCTCSDGSCGDASGACGDGSNCLGTPPDSGMPPPSCATGSGTNAATFVSQTIPAQVDPGSTFTIQVTMRNSGDTTWWRAPSMGFFLGSQDPQDNMTWGTNRGWMDSNACVAPGQTYTFSFTVTAPSTPGTYSMQWQMLQDAVAWFGDMTPVWNITVGSIAAPCSATTGTNGATFASQNIPQQVSAGSTFAVQVTMTNSGATTWSRFATEGYFLGSQAPQDNTTWGTNRGWMDPSACVTPGQSYTFNFTVTAPTTPGTYTMQWQMLQDGVEWFGDMTLAVTITVSMPTMPAAPSRDQISAVKLTFQGLTVTLPDYNGGMPIPWFEPAITSISASDRQIVYQAKHAAGDTHIIMAVTWNYSGDNGYSYPVPGNDLTTNLPAFRALVQEAIQNNFYVMVFMGGDGESKPGGGYNDPVGWTYGYSWLMDNVGSIVSALQQPTDLTPYVIFVPGWDSVVPGWAPDASNPSSGTYVYPSELDNFLLKLRSLIPSGYIGVELAAGYCHWGGGIANYTTPSGQSGPSGGQALDIILQEFPGPPTGDQVWQIAGRELGPSYQRPADEPAGDDPSPPYYLQGGSPRGPWYPIAFEYDEYRWVRNGVSAGDIQNEQAYLKGVGYPQAD